MKNIIRLIATFVILFSVTQLEGQNKFRKIEGEKTEKRADKNNFVVYQQGNLNVVYNQNNALMLFESNFDIKTKDKNLDYLIEFPERSKVDSLVLKIIAPFYRNYISKSGYELEEFEIYLHSKLDKKVCELVFRYDSDVKIPLKSIEKLEKEILSLNLEFEFIGDDYYFKDAIWVYYPLRYSVSQMKKKSK